MVFLYPQSIPRGFLLAEPLGMLGGSPHDDGSEVRDKVIVWGLSLSALTLLMFRKSSPQQPGHPEALQKKETHSHPHPHPHPHDTQALPTPPGEKPPTLETAAAPKSPSMGLGNAFQSALSLSETDPLLASEKLHDIAAELGDGDPKWTEYYHLLGHSIVNRPPGPPKVDHTSP